MSVLQAQQARGAADGALDGHAEETFFALVADLADDDGGAVVLGVHLAELVLGLDAADEPLLVGAGHHLREIDGALQAKRAAQRRQEHQVVVEADLAFGGPAVHLVLRDEEPGHAATLTRADGKAARARPAPAPTATARAASAGW